MRAIFRVSVLILVLVALTGCASKFKSYNGPAVTKILVFKSSRTMHLLHESTVLRSFRIDLGFAPTGDKRISGDGKTPEGVYYIDRRNPRSQFHLSLGISYPNKRDIAEAAALGKSPGGNIFIHGRGRAGNFRGPDWTWGCIAVTNKEMEEIYAMVRKGTPIIIYR